MPMFSKAVEQDLAHWFRRVCRLGTIQIYVSFAVYACLLFSPPECQSHGSRLFLSLGRTQILEVQDFHATDKAVESF